jgi:hypothetical protein
MPTKRRPAPAARRDPATATDIFFARELPGETPPTRATLERLYAVATKLYAFQPWKLLDEGALVLTRDPATGETCYCGATGELGEDVAVRAYLGDESYRLFRGFSESGTVSPGDFIAGQRSLSVEFARKGDLEAQDKNLLLALGHPMSQGKRFPIFHAVRPEYQPWFVTEPEARLLTTCLSAVLTICDILTGQPGVDYWTEENTYPLVTRTGDDEGHPDFTVEVVKVPIPREAPLAPARLSEEQVGILRAAGRGAPPIELDLFRGISAVGGKYERKSWMRGVLAVDGRTGIVLQPVLPDPEVPTADALASALVKAVQYYRALPSEVRVLSGKFKDCLAPVTAACGLPVKVVKKLPLLTEAREQMMAFLGDPGFPGS